MIKTPSTTMIGGAGIWTPGCTVIGGQQTITQFIKSLFADGTQGIYLNAQDAVSVSDLSSIKDLSGNNNHALQANATSRATLITDPSGYKSLKFDGVDDCYVTPSIDFTGTDKVTVIAAVLKLSDATRAMLLEFGSGVTNGSFRFESTEVPNSDGMYFGSRGTYQVSSKTNLSAPASFVATMQGDIATNLAYLKVNNIVGTPSGSNQGGGNYSNYPLYIGRRAGTLIPFNGQIYALLVIGKLLDDATIQRIEHEFAKYVGVNL